MLNSIIAFFILLSIMKNYLFLLVLISLISCDQQQSQKLPKSKTVAIVGDSSVTADLLQAFLITNGIAGADKATTKKALDALSTQVAMANIAKKKNLKLSTNQLNTLEYFRIKSFATLAQQNYLSNNEITEDEIQQEYNNANQLAGNKQYHLHHLLYQDEIQAIKKLDNIQSVADYNDLEKSFIQENPHMRGIGDLGWVTLGQLPKVFTKVLPLAQQNSVINQVVNSQKGAHIIYLEATRAFVPPKLNDVKEGIIKTLKAKRLSKFTQLAKAKAHIQTKE